MLQTAAEAGTTDIVATPHANPQYEFNPDLIRERLEEVRYAARVNVQLYTGCDFHLSFDNIEDALVNRRKYTINQSRYLLVEFSDMIIFPNTSEIFYRLLDADMVPIITHPERNPLLRDRVEQIAQWVSDGSLVQVTGQSLLGHFGKKPATFSRTLLDRGLVHFIASDGHDLKFRPPKMDGAYAWLSENYSPSLADLLCKTNPRAVLTGDSIESPEAAPETVRKWFQFWR